MPSSTWPLRASFVDGPVRTFTSSHFGVMAVAPNVFEEVSRRRIAAVATAAISAPAETRRGGRLRTQPDLTGST